MSDEAFLYLSDMALHIPPFEFTAELIRKGRARWEDFIPVNRYVQAIDAILKAGRFPPPEHPQAPGQYYRIVFDSVARSRSWPSYDETNAMWLAKLQKYKDLRKEATDGYRYRLTAERSKNPSAIVFADCVEACMRQFVPILHLTPTGLKSLGGYIIGESRYFTPFEVPGFSPFTAMRRDLPLWQDFPSPGTLEDLRTEPDNQMLFRQEVAYRIVSTELKNAVLYRDRFVCPFAKCGCDVAMPECEGRYGLDNLPAYGCCVRFYGEAKQIDLSRFRWVAQ